MQTEERRNKRVREEKKESEKTKEINEGSARELGECTKSGGTYESHLENDVQ